MLAPELRERLRHLEDLPSGGASAPHPARRRRALHDALGAAVATTPEGELLVWERTVSEAYSDAAGLTGQVLAALGRAAEHHDTTLAALSEVSPERIAFVDLETVGLHGRPLFMIGSLIWRGGHLRLRQAFARDYSEECAVLADFGELAGDIETLITFNGKSFDWPFLRDRMIYHRLPPLAAPQHADLLHHARRRWRGVFADCRLHTLEWHLCRRVRRGDIPGCEIPARYHEFVRRQDPRLIAPVFHHNRLDLITLAELLVILLRDRCT